MTINRTDYKILKHKNNYFIDRICEAYVYSLNALKYVIKCQTEIHIYKHKYKLH